MVRLDSLVRDLSKQPGLPRPDSSGEHTLTKASPPTASTSSFSKAEIDAGKLVLTSASSRHAVSCFWAGLFDEVGACASARRGFQKHTIYHCCRSRPMLD